MFVNRMLLFVCILVLAGLAQSTQATQAIANDSHCMRVQNSSSEYVRVIIKSSGILTWTVDSEVVKETLVRERTTQEFSLPAGRTYDYIHVFYNNTKHSISVEDQIPLKILISDDKGVRAIYPEESELLATKNQKKYRCSIL